MIKERERQKAEEVEAVKRSLMQSGMVRNFWCFPHANFVQIWVCYNYGASSVGYGLLAFYIDLLVLVISSQISIFVIMLTNNWKYLSNLYQALEYPMQAIGLLVAALITLSNKVHSALVVTHV